MDANQRFLVTLFLGMFGVHRFVDRRYGTGLIWLLSGGVLSAGWAWDLCQAAKPFLKESARQANR